MQRTEMGSLIFLLDSRGRPLFLFLGLALQGYAMLVDNNIRKALCAALVGRLEKAIEMHESAAVLSGTDD